MPRTPYDVVTDRIIAKLEAGVVPWRKPWSGRAGMPKNLTSGKEYRGVNVFLLHCLGYESPYFLTFNQAKKLGGYVCQGERGCPVVFWKWFEKEDENGETKRLPVLRYYTVFNVAQCKDVEAPAIEVPERQHNSIEAAEQLVQAMPNAPEIRHGLRGASYNPTEDAVQMPRPEVFESGEAYYSTVFHELTHSTGHPSRLSRKLETLTSFGSRDYSREELVAEMGAAFLCGEVSILETNIEQSAAYIDGWLRRLRNDRRLVVTAAAQAQKASDYILGQKFAEEPAA